MAVEDKVRDAVWPLLTSALSSHVSTLPARETALPLSAMMHDD